jgi:hypothetical protein
MFKIPFKHKFLQMILRGPFFIFLFPNNVSSLILEQPNKTFNTYYLRYLSAFPRLS